MAAVFDTVAAISTPPGKGGVALIRISGAEADKICERIFLTASGKPYSEIRPRVATYGYVVSAAAEAQNEAFPSYAESKTHRAREKIDDVLLSRFPAPHSYTGEDTVEICCHGGILVTRCVLEEILRAGARCAEAGEFTRRAFINGKLSLTETEAIGTLLVAGSREQIKLSSEPSRRALSERVTEIRGELVSIMSSVYARIDYPDENLGEYDDEHLAQALEEVRKKLSSLASTYRTGRAITEGISAVIAGKPNVGKSSIYNLILGEDAAIVTDIAGTTRDVLERSIPLGRVMLRLFDTAGIRDNITDAVERIGIQKSREAMEKCQLLFAVFDNSRPFDDEDAALLESIKPLSCAKIAIINKTDLKPELDLSLIKQSFDRIAYTSKTCEAETIRALTEAVEAKFTDEKIVSGSDAIIFSARQHSAIISALDCLNEAITDLSSGFMQDAVSGHVERAIGAIGELDGRQVDEEIVADIFSKFCVGK